MAFFVAPSLPAIIVMLPSMIILGGFNNFVSAADGWFLLIVLICFPATWILFPILYLLFEFYKIRSLASYICTGIGAGFLIGFFLAPAMAIALVFAPLVSGAIWFCLWYKKLDWSGMPKESIAAPSSGDPSELN